MANTKAPSGLTITRNGMRFVCAWKISDSDYRGGQQFKWRYRTGKWSEWKTETVGLTQTSRPLVFSASDFFPTTKTFLFDVEFAVRGKKADTESGGVVTSYSWSAWVYKTMPLYTPKMPTLTATLDSQAANRCTYAWSVAVSDKDASPFVNVEYQSLLAKESNVTDGSKFAWNSSNTGWRSGTSTQANSVPIEEDTVLLAQNSYTRWFRVRARGAGGHKWSNGGNGTGCSYWRYVKHVYATPYQPKITGLKREGATNWVRVRWTANATPSHPIDTVDVDYCVGTPRANRTAPANPSWQTARTINDTSGADEVTFLADALDLDECLWVRVNPKHDANENPTDAALVASGKLTAPTGLSVSTDTSTYRATVEATNNSSVPDSRMAVIFRRAGHKDIVVGIIPNGLTSATVQCPNWGTDSISFGVYAFQGSVSAKTSGSNPVVTTYAVNANMKSAELWDGGSVPIAPTGVTADTTETSGEVLLTWNWSWRQANRAELSWSQNPNAWESTDEPDTYIITNEHAAKWRVSGLDVGSQWYFAIRLARETADGITYGPYSDPVMVDLSSVPEPPVLSLSRAVLPRRATLTASWTYNATDGAKQTYAEICSAYVSGGAVTYSTVIAHTKTAQSVEVRMPSSWNNGETHWMCVRVKSSSGRVSEWSAPVAITVAEPITCAITQTSLQSMTIGEGDDARTVDALTAMPLTVTVTGAGEGGTTSLLIERAKEYHVIRPDETVRDGYDGETVTTRQQTGETQMIITDTDLVGVLDDGAAYRIIATVEDGYGQTASAELDFEVHWSHQAEVPTATVTISNNAAIITPVAPDGAVEGDVCDIYRLTADLPELIVQGGEFGTAYVDPYPAIGPTGGHRIVHRTLNGDYITEDGTPAWVDTRAADGDLLESQSGIIDFGGDSLEFVYNPQVNNSWGKDFQQTKYLGGSIVGDWNAGVSRTATFNAVVVSADTDIFQALRRLAEYSGICHVRTPEGSSYSADVQVGDSVGYDSAGKIVNVTLTITRVDAETLDGIAYSEWVSE